MQFSSIQAVSLAQKPCAVPRKFPFTAEVAAKAIRFHQTLLEYAPTPLRTLPQLAQTLGVAEISVKDESQRFGLNAFKGLGGSYAIGRILAERLGLSTEDFTFEQIAEALKVQKAETLTFVTATDGNHGRSVAWTAKLFGQKSVVFMPKGSALERLENIRKLGAEASITDRNYDDTVRLAADYAAAHNGILLQDTTMPGYEEIPTHIMQGYLTMAQEALDQMKTPPTHVFLQAGVGAMAGAVAGYLAARFGERRPVVTIVEPNAADCIFRTAAAHDGQLHRVGGSLSTIMAGLACGEPCAVGWQVLFQYADHFVSVPDDIAKLGMRVLGAPLSGDPRIISGESGAAGLGLAFAVLNFSELASLKQRLGLTADSRILCFSTEGATDRSNYKKIVWGI